MVRQKGSAASPEALLKTFHYPRGRLRFQRNQGPLTNEFFLSSLKNLGQFVRVHERTPFAPRPLPISYHDFVPPAHRIEEYWEAQAHLVDELQGCSRSSGDAFQAPLVGPAILGASSQAYNTKFPGLMDCDPRTSGSRLGGEANINTLVGDENLPLCRSYTPTPTRYSDN